MGGTTMTTMQGSSDYGSSVQHATALAARACEKCGMGNVCTIPKDTRNARALLKNMLTVLPVDPDDTLNSAINAVLDIEDAHRPVTESNELARIAEDSRIAIWRGDITTLRVDGIVNAANDQMLGCFRANHPCIDNAIHCAAGPGLRAECRRIMTAQGHREETGVAKVTEGYHLPASYVIHTVGPIAHYKGHEQPEALASCYNSCLDAADVAKMESVAFCCISTGVFGYPQRPAAEVACQTVKRWLAAHPDSKLKLVIFNVFMQEDLAIYNEVAPAVFAQ